MTFDVGHVIFLLLEKFKTTIPTDPNISRQESKVAIHFASVLEQAIVGDLDVEEQDELTVEDDGDWDVDDFQVTISCLIKKHSSIQAFDDVLPSHMDVRIGDKFVTREELQEALDYYRQPEKGTRTLSVMSSRFRWIVTEAHLKKLRQFEKQKIDFKESRTIVLKFLGSRMYEVVKEKLENGVTLHDKDLMMIARDINQRETKVENFRASQSWISRWKRSHRIVSRRITKFITRKCFLNMAAIEKSAEDFVEVSRREMSLFHPSQIFNADQTGIVKELHGARSLSFLGDKDVERIVQAKSSLTHSFTLLPMLFQDGTLGEKAYMVMAEPSGEFPASRPIPDCPNLVVRAGKIISNSLLMVVSMQF
ncbi:hypothetical protein CRE_01347 [Caenorhabditis remanei]|uniref:HTH CENPB-type domain-containing protein n=1 Tax=Caenorhabditis remanei TaxID=31234 RepID=E3ND95_CAERE|nr:hypothetical protein CRE_01347 [Caenorhabditis remanei]